MKKFLVVMLALLVCLVSLPLTAVEPSAAGTCYVAGASGKYTYDASTCTLTLQDGFNANSTPQVNGSYTAQIYATGGLNIVVNGKCTIYVQRNISYDYNCGIFCVGKLNISGSGTLDIRFAGSFPTNYAVGIISASSSNPNFNGGQTQTTVEGGVTVNVIGTSAMRYYGIIANLNINDATVNVNSGSTSYENGACYGVRAHTVNVNSLNSVLNVSSSEGALGTGIYCGSAFNFYYGNVTVIGQERSFGSDGIIRNTAPCKIYCNTAATPSTTQWDGTTGWNNYRYFHIESVTQTISGGYRITASKLLSYGTSLLTLTFTSANPEKYTVTTYAVSPTEFDYGVNEIYVELAPQPGYKLGTGSLTVLNLGCAYTATYYQKYGDNLVYKISVTLPDTRTLVQLVTVRSGDIVVPEYGKPVTTGFLGGTMSNGAMGARQLTDWYLYNPSTETYSKYTASTFAAGQYKAYLNVRVQHTLGAAPTYKVTNDTKVTVDGVAWTFTGDVTTAPSYVDYKFESPTIVINADNTHSLTVRLTPLPYSYRAMVRLINADDYSVVGRKIVTTRVGTPATCTFENVPLGNYIVSAAKGEGENAHQTRYFEVKHTNIETKHEIDQVLCGDVNMSGAFEVSDLSLVVNAALSNNRSVPQYCTDYQRVIMDYDADGYIDVLDCVQIERIVHGH